MAPFVILGLPRSRTAWLARFLTYNDHVCGHEELRHMRSLEDIRTWFTQPNIGTAETAAAPFWRLIEKVAPNAHLVVVRRKPDEVVDSLLSIPGVRFDWQETCSIIRRLDQKLDQIAARRKDALVVSYEDLDTSAACRAVFEHCLPYPWNHQHWAKLCNINVQCDFAAMARYVDAYLPALQKLASIAKHRTLTDMALHKAPETNGMTFQVEDFDVWLRDARHLFAEHLVQVGESPDNWKSKNIPLMRDLHKSGAMQIVTARANGRIFGYLQTIVGPSLVKEDLTTAAHTTFFASPDAPGIGVKLQRTALRALRDRGVGEVLMQAGIRGSGPKLGTMFKRLGAEEDGHVFRLQLAEA